MTEQEEIKLHRFCKQMGFEMDDNDFKGSILEWKNLKEKLADFEYHKSKLHLAIKEENTPAIKEFVADCANILLAIGDEFNLYDYPSERTENTFKTKDSVFKMEKVSEQGEEDSSHIVKNIMYGS